MQNKNQLIRLNSVPQPMDDINPQFLQGKQKSPQLVNARSEQHNIGGSAAGNPSQKLQAPMQPIPQIAIPNMGQANLNDPAQLQQLI